MAGKAKEKRNRLGQKKNQNETKQKNKTSIFPVARMHVFHFYYQICA